MPRVDAESIVSKEQCQESQGASVRELRALKRVGVELKHDKVHADDCAECETREGKIDKIERVLTLEGDLEEMQRQRLLEIANRCPVHRTLQNEVWIPTRLA